MNRVYFNAGNFMKFLNATPGMGWNTSFKVNGFKTYQFEYHNDPRHSLSEEEYTWFVLRWS